MNTIKNSQGSMSPIDSSFPTTSEYSTTADVQEKCIKFDLMTMIKVLKELCKFLKEIEENTSKKMEKMNKSLIESQEKIFDWDK